MPLGCSHSYLHVCHRYPWLYLPRGPRSAKHSSQPPPQHWLLRAHHALRSGDPSAPVPKSWPSASKTQQHSFPHCLPTQLPWHREIWPIKRRTKPETRRPPLDSSAAKQGARRGQAETKGNHFGSTWQFLSKVSHLRWKVCDMPTNLNFCDVLKLKCYKQSPLKPDTQKRQETPIIRESRNTCTLLADMAWAPSLQTHWQMSPGLFQGFEAVQSSVDAVYEPLSLL